MFDLILASFFTRGRDGSEVHGMAWLPNIFEAARRPKNAPTKNRPPKTTLISNF